MFVGFPSFVRLSKTDSEIKAYCGHVMASSEALSVALLILVATHSEASESDKSGRFI
jgi:hypothetical protein